MTEMRKENEDLSGVKAKDANYSKGRRPYNRNARKPEQDKSKEIKTNEGNSKIEVKDVNKQELNANNKKAHSKNQSKFEFKKSNLKIIPLGGLEEIGNNMTIFE